MTDDLVLAAPKGAVGSSRDEEPTMLRPLPSDSGLPRRFSDFATMGEALDYAASGASGFNFHDARGNLARP